MAALGSSVLTLADYASRLDPNDKVARIIEVLTDVNEIVPDVPWKEGNLLTGDRTIIRSGLPSGSWRQLNKGVSSEKSTTVPVTDTCGILETYSKVDKELAGIGGNPKAVRWSEAQAFIEGLSQTMATTLFYGDTDTDEEKFMGFKPRYDDTSGDNSDSIKSAGGTGSDNTSIWLVGWGERTVRGIYPKGSSAGLVHEDLGEDTFTDSDDNEYQGYRDHFIWKAGLTIKDWRYVVRICNIDVSNLTKTGDTGADLIDLMDQATAEIPNLSSCRPSFYCNKTILSYFKRQVRNHDNVQLNWEEITGKKRALTFDGIPIKKCDALLSTESQVT